jgi:WD40 repeat protein
VKTAPPRASGRPRQDRLLVYGPDSGTLPTAFRLPGKAADLAGSGVRVAYITTGGRIWRTAMRHEPGHAARGRNSGYVLDLTESIHFDSAATRDTQLEPVGLCRVAFSQTQPVLAATVTLAHAGPSWLTVLEADGTERFQLSRPEIMTSVALSPTGEMAVVATGEPSRPVLWDARDGVELFECDTPPPSPQSRTAQLGHVAFSPRGDEFAFARDDFIAIWGLVAEEPRRVLGTDGRVSALSGTAPPPIVQTLAWHPDGDHLTAGCDDGTLRIWNIRSGVGLGCVDGLKSVRQVACSPDGKTIGSLQDAVDDNGCRGVWLWEFATLIGGGLP